MKKTMFITMLLTALSVKAQTSFTSSTLAVISYDGGIQVELDTFSAYDYSLKIQESSSNSTIIDIGNMMQCLSGTLSISGGYTINYPTFNVPSYTLTTGHTYSVKCSFSSIVWFKLLCHNPYHNFKVCIFGINNDGYICFKQTIATIEYARFLAGTYYHCYNLYLANNSCTFSLTDSANELISDYASTNVTECFIGISFVGD